MKKEVSKRYTGELVPGGKKLENIARYRHRFNVELFNRDGTKETKTEQELKYIEDLEIDDYYGYYKINGRVTIGYTNIYLDNEKNKEIIEIAYEEGNVPTERLERKNRVGARYGIRNGRPYIRPTNAGIRFIGRTKKAVEDTVKGKDISARKTKISIPEYPNISKVSYYISPINKTIVTLRDCKARGINYNTINIKDLSKIDRGIKTIEEIYAYHEDYANVRVEGNKLFIRGWQGEYMYDMDIVHEQYGRKVDKGETITAKANLFDKNIVESVSQKGVLIKKYSDVSDVLHIGREGIKSVAKEAIKLSNKNTKIVLDEHLTKCSRNSIVEDRTYNSYNIKELEVNCGENAFIGMWVSMVNSMVIGRDRKITIKFNRDITPKEYVTIKEEEVDRKPWRSGHRIKANNIDEDNMELAKIDEKFVSEAMKIKLDKRRKKLNTYKELTTNEIRHLNRWVKYDLIYLWTWLEPFVSTRYRREMADNLRNIDINISNQLYRLSGEKVELSKLVYG